MKIELGKYTYIFDEKTGIQEALRHGEPWRKEDLVGDNLVLAMAMKIEELQQELDDLMSQDATSRYNNPLYNSAGSIRIDVLTYPIRW